MGHHQRSTLGAGQRCGLRLAAAKSRLQVGQLASTSKASSNSEVSSVGKGFPYLTLLNSLVQWLGPAGPNVIQARKKVGNTLRGGVSQIHGSRRSPPPPRAQGMVKSTELSRVTEPQEVLSKPLLADALGLIINIGIKAPLRGRYCERLRASDFSRDEAEINF